MIRRRVGGPPSTEPAIRPVQLHLLEQAQLRENSQAIANQQHASQPGLSKKQTQSRTLAPAGTVRVEPVRTTLGCLLAAAGAVRVGPQKHGTRSIAKLAPESRALIGTSMPPTISHFDQLNITPKKDHSNP